MIGITNVVNKKASEVEYVNVTLKTDQSSHDVLVGVNFTLTYGSYTKSYTWNGSTITIEVPAYVTYTLTFSGVSNYTTPADITYTAQSGNSRTVTATYAIQYETVTVKCSGLSSGFTLTVKNATTSATIGSQTATSKSYSIPAGTKYYVTASSVSGYTKPSNSSTYTAVANNSRTITMTYVVEHAGTTSPTNGVYIQDTDGYCHTSDEWDGTYTANGIAVVTDNCSFVMALEDVYSSTCKWGGYGTTVSGITTTTDSSTAAADYDGEAQTDTIISTLGTGNAPAAEYCRAFTFPNGVSGYLGAAGEWQAALDNMSDIETALSTSGGTSLSGYYWTSTQFNSYHSWYQAWYDGDLSFIGKNYYNNVRAFAAI